MIVVDEQTFFAEEAGKEGMNRTLLSRPSLYQLAFFLSCNDPRSEIDGEMIGAYLDKKYGNLPRIEVRAGKRACVLDPKLLAECLKGDIWPMNVMTFGGIVFMTGGVYLEVEDGRCYTCFDILFPCKYRFKESGGDDEFIVSRTELESGVGKTPTNPSESLGNPSRIVFRREDDKLFIPYLETPSEGLKTRFLELMLEDRLQPDPYSLKLCQKYTPDINERVCFYDFKMDLRGVGVVKAVSDSGRVSFHCFMTYPERGRNCEVGYTCDDPFSVSLCTCNFESLEQTSKTTMLGNSGACLRRLSTELEKRGKVWRDRLLRVEPLGYGSERDRRYWYINDKLQVTSERDMGTLLHAMRYRCGNYFTDREAALKAVDKFKGMLEDYLASPGWPVWE